MSTDFMAPILRGVLTPFATRGDCLYHFWDQRFGWSGDYQNNLRRHGARSNTPDSAGREKRMPSRSSALHPPAGPLVLFNTTDVETGRRVVVGFPSIPEGFFLGSNQFPAEAREAAAVTDRSTNFAPVSLADYSPVTITELSLAPFGFRQVFLGDSGSNSLVPNPGPRGYHRDSTNGAGSYPTRNAGVDRWRRHRQHGN